MSPFSPAFSTVVITLSATSTNASFASDICDVATNIAGVRVYNDGADGYYAIPECFWTLSSTFSFFAASNVIITGSAAQPDPLLRFSALYTYIELNNVRLINPRTTYIPSSLAYPQGYYPYPMNWSSFLSRIPLINSLTLSGATLQGTLPSSLPSTLQSVDVSRNELTGTLPAIFSNVSLTAADVALNASSNRLSGTVPSSLFSAYNAGIVYRGFFDLSYNGLSGTLPATIFSPVTHASAGSVYVWLDLTSNKLTGALPSNILDVAVAENSYIWLFLGGNSLTGSLSANFFPSSIFRAGSVTVDVSNNQLTGTIPSNLFSNILATSSQLYNMRLKAANNKLTGSIPNFWPSAASDAPLLRADFDFSGNQLTGSVPDGYLAPLDTDVSLNQLYEIYWKLGSNQLSGSISPNLVNASSGLYTLGYYLNDNMFTGSLPATFSASGSLGYLALSLANNRLGGTLPTTCWDKVGGPDFSEFDLDISRNAFSGSIPDAFLSPISVNAYSMRLNASNCGFTGTIPQSLRKNVRIVELQLNDNKLSGSFPSALMFDESRDIPYDSLTVSVAGNQMNGTFTIPSLNNPYPVYVNVSRNAFSSISVDPAANYVVSLDVSLNYDMSGTVPSFWFNESSVLTTFSAAHTAMNGTFPVSIAPVLPLRKLDLSFTQIYFCNRSPETAWNSTQMTSCNLRVSSAHDCPTYLPSRCDTAYPVGAATTLSGSIFLSIFAALLSAILVIM